MPKFPKRPTKLPEGSQGFPSSLSEEATLLLSALDISVIRLFVSSFSFRWVPRWGDRGGDVPASVPDTLLHKDSSFSSPDILTH